MVQTQFFKRENYWLEEYKINFNLAIEKAKVINLFSLDVLVFLKKWLEKQISYIPREDVDNFLPCMELIFQNKNFYDFVLVNLEKVKNNWNILEYSFNLISALNDSKIDFEKSGNELIKKENLEKAELKSINEDKKKLEGIEQILKIL